MNTTPTRRRPLAVLLATLSLAAAMPGCAPLIIGGAAIGGSMLVLDRRTSGAQLEDQSIELKAAARVRELATLGHVNVTSYNRQVLVTGEVPTEPDRVRVGEAMQRLENVRSVVNELVVAGNSTLGQRSNDSLLSTKVKATLVDAKDLQAGAMKVVTERGVVYLMGRVTEREAARAAELTSSIPGVQKVVRVFEILTEQELANLGSASAPAAAPAPIVTPDAASAPAR